MYGTRDINLRILTPYYYLIVFVIKTFSIKEFRFLLVKEKDVVNKINFQSGFIYTLRKDS